MYIVQLYSQHQCIWGLRNVSKDKNFPINEAMYIFILVSAKLAQVQTIFSFRRTTPNLYMLASCLAYSVSMLSKCIWRLRNIQRQL